MPRLQRIPYCLASNEHIRVNSWQNRDLNGELQPLPSALDDWDPATPVKIEALVVFHPAALIRDCQLSPDALLRMALLWRCTGTGLRGRGSSLEIKTANGTHNALLAVDIPGHQLSDRLVLAVTLILSHPSKKPRSLAARQAGNLLWSEERSLLLENRDARFPTELRDFTDFGWLEPQAGWYLDWDPDNLHQLVNADLRLYINAAHESVRQVATGGVQEDRDRVIRDAIRFDVARTLIEGALENDDFVSNPDEYADGTVGAAIRRLIRTLFLDCGDVNGLAYACRNRRFIFEMQLQDSLRLFADS